MTTKPKILRKLRINRVASVDRGAGDGVEVMLMKRDDTATEADARRTAEQAAEHLKKAGNGDPPENERNAMSSELKKALNLPETATDAELAAAITKAATDATAAAATATALAKANSDLAIAKAVAAMTDTQKEHYAELEKADKDKAKAFLDMKSEDKDAECKKAAAGDETVTIEGRTISKRAVGDDMFAVMKSQAKRLDDQADAIAKANESVADAGFAKRAADEFGHLAGKPEDRALVLKHLAKADEPTRAAAEAILKAAEAATKFAFEKRGHNPGEAPEGTPESDLAKKTAEIRKAHPDLTEAQAMDQALVANPELYDAMQTTGAPAN